MAPIQKTSPDSQPKPEADSAIAPVKNKPKALGDGSLADIELTNLRNELRQ